MLIYNYKKEFIGIDEKDLKTLGLENLAQLRAEAADFADLFVKTPGFVHNFQHVHWIDYIACADSSEQPQVVINANGNLFKASVTITTSYLADSPTQKAYFIQLSHFRVLTDAEKNSIAAGALDKPVAATTPVEPVSFTSDESDYETPKPQQASDLVEDEYDVAPAVNEQPANADSLLSVDDVVDDSFELHPELAPKDEDKDAPLDIPDSIDIPDSLEVEENVDEIIEPTSTQQTPHITSDIVVDEDLQEVLHSDYVYDPQIASNELGLPIDLIEEFIEDFINQAKEFKSGLYTALDDGDIDNVKILSHKLKGVAANLRIEDALEVLTTINTTSDINTIKKNLDIFYVIIAKLAGENLNIAQDDQDEPVKEELSIDLKDEKSVDETNDTQEQEITIADDDVPDQIELAELADDNFVAQNDLDIELQEEATPDETLSLEVQEDTVSTPSTQTYSKEQIAQEIGVDSESLHELLEEFNTEAQTIVSTMKTALNNSDLDILKAQARQLHGMSDNIRFNELSNELQTLQDVADIESASTEVSKIETLLEQISLED